MSAAHARRGRGGGDRGRVLLPAFAWRAGPWTARSLARAGYDVLAGAEPAHIAGKTRDCRAIVRHPPASDADAFLACVEEICIERDVAAVVPVDDEVLQLLTKRLSSPGGARLIGPTADQYARLCDKASLAAVAAAAGFAAPAQVVADEGGPKGDWPSFPSMVKPHAPERRPERVVVGKPVLVRNEKERDVAVEAFCEQTGGALVEEHIRGDAWRVHFVRTPSSLHLLSLRSLRNYPPGTGQSSLLRVGSAPLALLDASRRLLEQAEYLGPGSVQAIERDGQFFVHDVNLRMPVTLGITLATGFDMPRLAVDAALGRDGSDVSIDQETPRMYVSLYGEGLHLLDGIRGRPTGAPVGKIAQDIVRALVSRNGVLDPVSLHDGRAFARGFAEVARRVRTRQLRSSSYAESPVHGGA